MKQSCFKTRAASVDVKNSHAFAHGDVASRQHCTDVP